MKQLEDEADYHIIPVNGYRPQNKIKKVGDIKEKISVEWVKKISLKKIYH